MIGTNHNRSVLIGISLVLLCTYYDLRRAYLNPTTLSNDNSQNIHDESSTILPPPKIETQRISTIKIRYCYSSGYQNLFKQFSELVRTDYPTMTVIGENYPPVSLKAFLARVLSIIKMVFLVCILFGQNPFPLLSIPTPRVYLWALRNKMYACLMIFFFSNSLESYLVSTGAFEISVDDIPLWSKLDTGRLPSTNEFIQKLTTFINPTDNIYS